MLYPSLSFRSSEAPPILELLFEGSNGSTTFLDTSPNAFTVSRSGTDAQISTAQFAEGVSSLLNTNTVNSHLTVPHNPVFDFAKNDFTIEFYVRVNTGGFATSLIRKGDWSTYSPWLFAFDGTHILFYSSGTAPLWNLASGFTLVTPTLMQWYKIAVQRKNLQFYGYRDDSLVFTTPYQDLSVLDNTLPVYIAGNATVSGFDGYIDSLKIYNYAKY